MARWTRILPFFIVAWYARKHCEKRLIDGRVWVEAYPYEVFIRMPIPMEKPI